MLISETMQKVIRVLLNKQTTTLRELAQEAGISLGLAVRNTRELEKTGYLTKKPKIVVRQFEKLLKAWSYVTSINELEKVYFTAAERPQYVMKKIAGATKKKLIYAFTLFSATELLCPHVAPNETYLYILKTDRELWKEALRKENIFPAEKGNVVCFIADLPYFVHTLNVREMYTVSLPQLYVDLFSYGGLGIEAAEELLKLIKQHGDNHV